VTDGTTIKLPVRLFKFAVKILAGSDAASVADEFAPYCSWIGLLRA
jgi:hypothetical protein